MPKAHKNHNLQRQVSASFLIEIKHMDQLIQLFLRELVPMATEKVALKLYYHV